MLSHDLRIKLDSNKITKVSNSKHVNKLAKINKKVMLKDKFPKELELGGNELYIGEVYDISSKINFITILFIIIEIETNKEMCLMKNDVINILTEMCLVIHNHNLIFCVFTDKPNMATIAFKYQLRNLELYMDKTDKSNINLFYEREVILLYNI